MGAERAYRPPPPAVSVREERTHGLLSRLLPDQRLDLRLHEARRIFEHVGPFLLGRLLLWRALQRCQAGAEFIAFTLRTTGSLDQLGPVRFFGTDRHGLNVRRATGVSRRAALALDYPAIDVA
jgi:hypothetical protein